MGWRLAGAEDAAFAQEHGSFIKRFDPVYWTVDFPRPMMAAVTTTAPDAMRVDAVFYKEDDLAGLIWATEDSYDHPLLQYETLGDYRACRLRFRWRSQGLKPLDAVNGPTLTIEGRDASGVPRSWYVRLWNYAAGDPEDAQIVLDFARLSGGFRLPEEEDPVWAGDIDRMFLSLVPPAFSGGSAVLPAPAEGYVEISGIASEGSGSMLAIGDGMIPAHTLRIATGYDDSYNQTPARLMRNAYHLGYRDLINHYVGMSHYFRLGQNGGGEAFLVRTGADPLNLPCARWHADFARRARSLGYDIILSLSYELFDAHAPEGWKQRAENGDPALTGWVPPSTLLSPANAEAMAYLQDVGRAFAALAVAAGQPVRFQIGEPWWWVLPGGRICLYDAAARAAFGGAPVSIPDITATLNGGQTALLDQAGALLAASTAALRDAVRGVAAEAEVMLLAYLPTVLDAAAPELKRAALPIGWASPAFDRLQLEDYDWVTSGNRGATARGIAEATARLGYPVAEQHYLAGFVLSPGEAALWGEIDAAAEAARLRGTADVFLWALPQITRDGFVHFEIGGEAQVNAFDDVYFPIALGREASVETGFSTAIITTASGHEQRNTDLADARLRFDAGPGVRSEADMQALIGFFRARRGAARGFRFRDPFDDSSNGMTGLPGPADQLIGIGDGIRTRFDLVKHYGGNEGDPQQRRISRPVRGSVTIAVSGQVRPSEWTLEEGGTIAFAKAPPPGKPVTAGFRFDVPVRFAEDRLEVTRAGFAAGEAVSVPLVEIREA
jgi:uncharacterized protein (TIGR02217 family)